jgi:anti-sigma-K factor RskA
LAEPSPPNIDLAAYLLGTLEPGERARVEQELAADPVSRAAAAELQGTVEMLKQAAPPYAAPAGLEARTFRALERAVTAGEPEHESEHEPEHEPERARAARRVPRLRLPALRRVAAAGALAVLLAGAVLAGTRLSEEGPPGEFELTASLTAPGGGERRATAEVRETGIGRVVSFDTTDLPILPKGEYYALWFVGPEDSPESPDRIPAGTFHPDPEGRSQVRFAAAVDPAKYPVLAVTAEAGDGDPSPTAPDVLRSAPAQ